MNKTERIFKIEQVITARKVISFQALLDELEVSRATLKRDLEYLRSRMKAPIVYDREANGYRFGGKRDRSLRRAGIPVLLLRRQPGPRRACLAVERQWRGRQLQPFRLCPQSRLYRARQQLWKRPASHAHCPRHLQVVLALGGGGGQRERGRAKRRPPFGYGLGVGPAVNGGFGRDDRVVSLGH